VLFLTIIEVFRGSNRHTHYFFNFRVDISEKVNISRAVKKLKVLLKITKTNLIALLKATICITFLLYSIISQMDELIGAVFTSKGMRRCAEIP